MQPFVFRPLLLAALLLLLAGCSLFGRPSDAPGPEAVEAGSSVLAVQLTSSKGRTVQLFLYTPDERVWEESAASCVADAGDRLRQGPYNFYLQQAGAGAPVRQEVGTPFDSELLQFNESRPQMLQVLAGERGKQPDLLVVHQYASCNGSLIALFALAPDGRSLHHLPFLYEGQRAERLFVGKVELEGPGVISTQSYNNATGIQTTAVWEYRPKEGGLRSIRIDQHKLGSPSA